MPDRCDVCGAVSLEDQEFSEEILPFRKSKRYCPSCHRRFQLRLYGVLAILPLVVACIALVDITRRHIRLLDSTFIVLALIVVFQWVMIAPHEFGHALLARAFGFSGLRVFIGVGRPLFSFRLFGIPVLVSPIPFGGLTTFQASPKLTRWKHLATVAAGPAVNLFAAALAWHAIEPGGLRSNLGTLPAIILFANVLVLVQNLFPHHVRTPAGRTPSDGLQLWLLLFFPNRPTPLAPERVPLWQIVLCHVFKWTIFAIMLGATILFVGLGCLPFVHSYPDSGWQYKLLFPAIMALLASLAGWITVRVVREPISEVRKTLLAGGAIGRTTPWSPQQQSLLQRTLDALNANQPAAAEDALNQLLSSNPAPDPENYMIVLLLKVQALAAQDMARAETFCLDFLNTAAVTRQKIHLLDALASLILSQTASPHLQTAERLTRQGLQLAPDSLTLKGTLGSILAEQRRYNEAEPLLRECFECSPSLRDQGITCFYLGLVKLAAGKLKEAKKHIHRALELCPEPWLETKAKLIIESPLIE